MSDSPKDPLSSALAAWRLQPHADPHFRAIVWRRIGESQESSSWPRFARAHLAAITALVAAAIAGGAWSGTLEARQRTNADRAAVAANYVHRLDARWMRQQ